MAPGAQVRLQVADCRLRSDEVPSRHANACKLAGALPAGSTSWQCHQRRLANERSVKAFCETKEIIEMERQMAHSAGFVGYISAHVACLVGCTIH